MVIIHEILSASYSDSQNFMTDLGPVAHNAWRLSQGTMDLTRDVAKQHAIEFSADHIPLRINLAATALIIVDMQKFFCDPRPGQEPADRACHQAIGRLSELAPALRKHSVPVVWVNWGNRLDETNLPPNVRYAFNRGQLSDPKPFLTRDTAATEIVSELSAEAGDVHVDKYRLSGFWDTPLDSILRGLRVDTLLFAGVNLDQCVYHTLADASFLGYDCILLNDCAATNSPDYCTDATLYNVKLMGFVAESTAIMARI
ncbi:MAG: nicotinamidase-related amidase [Candidatus Azotimanducaceae bacterium]